MIRDRLPGQTSGAVAVFVGARVQVQAHLQGEASASVQATGKSALLLALVAMEGAVERRRAALLLWPDSPEQQARNNLRTLVHRLNHRCGVELLTGSEHLTIDPQRAQVRQPDTGALLAALQAGGTAACDLLAQAGVDAAGADALGAWLEAARQRLRRQQLQALSDALAQALDAAQPERAIALARACVQLEPLSEHAHRQLMDTLARCGDRAAALAAYEDCKAQLLQQLGVLPDEQTRTVQLRILQGQAQPAAAPRSMAAGLSPLGGAARFPLVEREAVLAELDAALAQAQHIQLQGEAGVGKTRLLRHVVQPHFEHVSIRPEARGEPYAAVAQLLQAVQPRRAPVLDEAEKAELARLAPMAFPGVQPSSASLSAPRLHAALRHWALRLAAAGVQRLVLDDVHYADAASQAAWSALLPPDETAPVLPLLLAHRTGEIEAPLAEALLAAQLRGQGRCITLPRLSLPGVRALLQAMHAEHADLQAAQLLQRTGGNPLFVIELAQHTLDITGAQATSADNLDALLRSRLAGCSAAAQQLASVAAVAAADFSVELAADVVRQPPLALMPAWTELQQRGLFADHGLAHDLVRDAVLGAVPGAIARTLHRQVAAHLQAQGLRGARVLKHWLAAEDFDQALPHAEHHLHATGAAGLPTAALELELFGLLERVSDAVLVDRRWLTADIHLRMPHDLFLGICDRMQALCRRVEAVAEQAAVRDWLAFERACRLVVIDKDPHAARLLLEGTVQHMPEQGLPRANCELLLAMCCYELGDGARMHVVRARDAMAGVPVEPSTSRLRQTLTEAFHFFCEPSGLVRTAAGEMRAARRRGALDLARRSRLDIAHACLMSGLSAWAQRHYSRYAAERPPAADAEAIALLGDWGMAAIGAGHYDVALRCFEQILQQHVHAMYRVWQAAIWLRLGRHDLASRSLDAAPVTDIASMFAVLHLHAITRAELLQAGGGDPVAHLRQAVAHARSVGIGGINLRLLEWEVALATLPAAERARVGEELAAVVRPEGALLRRLPRLLLEVAEAQAQAGRAGWRANALEAARELRRGRMPQGLYLPEALLRCAQLLQHSDPTVAASLRHLARRWVLQALAHVPDTARASFRAVPVNRQLLDAEATA